MSTYQIIYRKFVPVLMICLFGLTACGGNNDDECPAIIAGTPFVLLCFLEPQESHSGSLSNTIPPESPSGLGVKEEAVGIVKVSWEKVEDIRYYTVYRNGEELPRIDVSTGEFFVDMSTEELSTANYADSTVYPSSEYCYSVVSLKGSNRSGHSNEACITTSIDILPPAGPSLSTYVDGSRLTDIALIWNVPQSNIGNWRYFVTEGYKIYRNGVLIDDIKTPYNQMRRYYSDIGLTSESTYCYTIVAYDSSLNETPSLRKCITTSWHTWGLYPEFPLKYDHAYDQVSLNVDSWDTVHVAVGQAYRFYDISERRYQSYSRLLYTSNLETGRLDSVDIEVEPYYLNSVPAIAVDQSAYVHIVHGKRYISNRLGDPARFGEIVYEGAQGDEIKAIGLDSFGNSHLLIKNADGGLVHASLSGGAWVIETIAEAPAIYSDMVVDDKDVLHVAYYHLDSGELRYLNNALGDWVSEVVETTSDLNEDIAVAIGTDGKVHLGYADSTSWDLKYASNASGGWEVETPDNQGEVGSGASVAVDSAGRVHISYVDCSNDDLKYVTNESGKWMTKIIDASRFDIGVSRDTGIDVDSSGKIHIVYQADVGVMYATNR